jgi:nucleoside 2-deoxyribosyltransferase
MKIYIAGKWTSKQDIQQKMQQLKLLGHEITHDWTSNDGTLQESAILDINGVKNADIVIAVMDDPVYPYRGTLCEIGCALGLGKKVFVYGGTNPEISTFYKVCFVHHPLVNITNDWNQILKC